MTSALMSTYGSPDLEFARGEGCYLFTTDGQAYLDFAMGIAVNSLGHCHPGLVNALKKQADTLWHTSNLYRISAGEDLARKLVQLSFADKVFFCNSGTEAIECGFKILRRYHHQQGQSRRKRIISLTESFHGRTLAAIAAAANPSHTEGFLAGDTGFDQVAFGDLDALAAAMNDHTAGVILEPVQGEGGIRVVSPEYIQGVRRLCDQHGVLLMFDEVQCGVGRSGSFYAYEQLGVKPDVLASAKGLGGGFPIGACLATATAAGALTAGSHGSTFGGNPLAMAVGNAAVDEISRPEFLQQVKTNSAYLRQALEALTEQFPTVLSKVSGIGLMLGVKCVINNAEVVAALQQQKLLVVKAGANSIRLLPPLNVNRTELDRAISIVAEVASQLNQ